MAHIMGIKAPHIEASHRDRRSAERRRDPRFEAVYQRALREAKEAQARNEKAPEDEVLGLLTTR